jgi:hypothetical protein
MKDTELMAVVNRYTEACDDLGAGLFKQTEAETTTKHAKAAELYVQIQTEVQRLYKDAERYCWLRDLLWNQELSAFSKERLWLWSTRFAALTADPSGDLDSITQRQEFDAAVDTAMER